MEGTEVICLTLSDWCRELRRLSGRVLSKPLARRLRRLIWSQLSTETFVATATESLIREAKKHLMEGLRIGGRLYHLVVFTPKKKRKDGRRCFLLVAGSFDLKRKYANRAISLLSEC